MRTAFVAGATGYTGREVVRQLPDAGVRAIAHVRPDSAALAEWRERFRRPGVEVDATPWNVDALEATLRRVAPDAVFALLGTTQARVRAVARSGSHDASATDGDASYEAVDYGLTHMLLEATMRGAPSARFVYLSSLGANADSRNEYLRVRGRIEAELRASGLPWTSARPVFVSGPDRNERRLVERIGAVAGDALLNVVGLLGAKRLRDRYRSITGERLARALIHAADSADAANRVIDADDLQRRAGA